MKLIPIPYLGANPHQGLQVVFQARGRCMQTDLMLVVEEFWGDTSSSAAERAPPDIPDLYLRDMSVKQT